MTRSCVTISLVEEARGGPFIYWDGLAASCRQAAELGFDAVEIFPPGPDALDPKELKGLLDQYQLKLAAVGTGAGWVRGRLHLVDEDAGRRKQARQFIRSIIDAAGQFGASAIIGSMQGRWGDGVDRQQALQYLSGALNRLGEHARQYGVPLIYEPLNRYETNLCHTLDDGVTLLSSLSTDNVVLLADLFHMNIEEADPAGAVRAAREHIGHVHFADSNRRPVGYGHTDFGPLAGALQDIEYPGYISAEALPYPDPHQAAQATIEAYRKYFGSES